GLRLDRAVGHESSRGRVGKARCESPEYNRTIAPCNADLIVKRPRGSRFAARHLRVTIRLTNGRAAMRWCVSIGAVLVAGAMLGGDVTSVAATGLKPQWAQSKPEPVVDVELVLAVDVSYSMDMDELAIQREGYAQA